MTWQLERQHIFSFQQETNEHRGKANAMSWAFLDDNFPNHPKTVQAGAPAAYLFVCGICYCRRYHTGGFIPTDAVRTLGASTSPRALVDALLRVGFWERVEGGFRVHDYDAIYENDDVTKAKKEAKSLQKKVAGRAGGLAKAANRTSSRNLAECQKRNDDFALAHRVGDGTGSVALVSSEKKETPQFDVWFRQLTAAYPPQAVTIGHLSEHAFIQALTEYSGGPFEGWALMMSNLENQKLGHQWRVKGMVPKLQNWLRNGDWVQRHEAVPVSAIVNERTVRTMTSAAEFAKGGES